MTHIKIGDWVTVASAGPYEVVGLEDNPWDEGPTVQIATLSRNGSGKGRWVLAEWCTWTVAPVPEWKPDPGTLWKDDADQFWEVDTDGRLRRMVAAFESWAPQELWDVYGPAVQLIAKEKSGE